ncbi:mitotic spindle assembly checkpoint protein 1 [Vairimorpha apis BRL 01]|uniref:Spindle assembly checkpoint component MAD1 n=1 Tax=Vairimorpha apis BRL 01 TaxID=1037528 RepID=T0MA96_9MICR|nr:mitotic spindle assembly checkpoint protein 1 [Vairimorpha apis BRL 01]
MSILDQTHTSLKLSYDNLNTSYTSLQQYFTKYKKYITGILGYKIDMKDDKIVLSSLYSFDSEDLLIFNIKKDNLELVNNEFAGLFKNEINIYLIKGGSVPAFLSAVTLKLFNEKTFN